jgi:4-diphosphocytidyl-2-C-methyl-D-erythritol kinase
MNALRKEPLPAEFLLMMAGELGSDVPFFLCGSPFALAWGRGHRLLALPPLPARDILIAHPGVSMSTPEAFRQHDEARGEGYSVAAESLTLDALTSWDALTQRPENDFEQVVETALPRVAEVRDVMRHERAQMAMLSGSGSCVVGIFDREYQMQEAEYRLSKMAVKTWRVRTLDRMPYVG